MPLMGKHASGICVFRTAIVDNVPVMFLLLPKNPKVIPGGVRLPLEQRFHIPGRRFSYSYRGREKA